VEPSCVVLLSYSHSTEEWSEPGSKYESQAKARLHSEKPPPMRLGRLVRIVTSAAASSGIHSAFVNRCLSACNRPRSFFDCRHNIAHDTVSFDCLLHLTVPSVHAPQLDQELLHQRRSRAKRLHSPRFSSDQSRHRGVSKGSNQEVALLASAKTLATMSNKQSGRE